MFLSWRHILHHAPCPFLIFYCSSPASLMIAPVSLRAGVQLRATLYVYVGISDLSILKTSLSQYHKHFCFGLILQLFFCVCQLTTYFAPCTKSLLGFLLFAPPPPTSPMIAPISLPAGVQLRANLYDPSILKTWLTHYNIHSLFWSHIDDDVFCGKKIVSVLRIALCDLSWHLQSLVTLELRRRTQETVLLKNPSFEFGFIIVDDF